MSRVAGAGTTGRTPRDFELPVNRLSVGQQRRLSLALLFAERPDVLLLDEPTSHLSPLLVEQVERAVAG